MGSISIARILAVGGVLLLCHLFFAVVSLCASCWCRRSGVALFLGYSAVLLATVGTVLARKLLPGASSPEPGWSDGVLALNPAALLLDVVIPQGGMPVGSEVVPWYVVGAGTYALLSAGFFALGVVGLGRR